MSQHETTEVVVPRHAIAALPEKQANTGCTDLLARQQASIEVLHARLQMKLLTINRGNGALPCARPANGNHYSFCMRCLEVKEGEGTIGRTPATRFHPQGVARLKYLFTRSEVCPAGVASFCIIQGGGPDCMSEGDVCRLHMTDARCYVTASIGKAQHPLHCTEIRPSLHFTLYL